MSNLKNKLQQVKDDYSKEKGYDDFEDLIFDYVIPSQVSRDEHIKHMDEICKRYAEEVIKEASERVKITFSSCGDPMTCGCMGNCDHAVPRINKQSILKLIDEL